MSAATLFGALIIGILSIIIQPPIVNALQNNGGDGGSGGSICGGTGGTASGRSSSDESSGGTGGQANCAGDILPSGIPSSVDLTGGNGDNAHTYFGNTKGGNGGNGGDALALCILSVCK